MMTGRSRRSKNGVGKELKHGGGAASRKKWSDSEEEENEISDMAESGDEEEFKPSEGDSDEVTDGQVSKDTPTQPVLCFLCCFSFYPEKGHLKNLGRNKELTAFVAEVYQGQGQGNKTCGLRSLESMSICKDCVTQAEVTMKRKKEVDQVEGKARRLQLELLKEMQKLNNVLGEYSLEVGKMAKVVNEGNVACLEEQLKRNLKKKGMREENKFVEGLRNGIVSTSEKLEGFKEEIGEKFNNPGLKSKRKNPDPIDPLNNGEPLPVKRSRNNPPKKIDLPEVLAVEDNETEDNDTDVLLDLVPELTQTWPPFKQQIYWETHYRLEKLMMLQGDEKRLGIKDPQLKYCMQYNPSKDLFYVDTVPIILHEAEATLECSRCAFVPLKTLEKQVVSLMMQQHVQQTHLKMTYKCEICLEQFDTLKEYQRHVRQSHLYKEKCFKCDLCGISLATQNGLVKHRKITHRISTPSFYA